VYPKPVFHASNFPEGLLGVRGQNVPHGCIDILLDGVEGIKVDHLALFCLK
jgi:hypothetical protein